MKCAVSIWLGKKAFRKYTVRAASSEDFDESFEEMVYELRP